jgi:type IX secretion system PorP/SprF family membrane protein
MNTARKKVKAMKRIIIIFISLMPALSFGQQFPFMENYNLNPFSLSPAYAGIKNSKTLFMDYRSDWTGIEGGPKTYQLSYNDKFKNSVGLGGKFIYDKTDIFKQTLILGTYTYEVKIREEHTLNFGLSMGLYRNSIDLAKYYNDPNYIDDIVLMYGQQKSKIKFATDISALYRYRQGEAGIVFSNLMFGTVKYSKSEMTYKPFKNYLIHAAYLFKLDDKWTVKPVLVFRGGKNIPSQFDLSGTVTWSEKIWATALVRTGGIFGIGLGGEVYQGILLNYSYNLSSNVATNTFGSHQLTLGIRIFQVAKELGAK